MRAVVEPRVQPARFEPLDLERRGAQVAVDREALAVVGDLEAAQVDVLAPDPVLPAAEPVAPWVYERDRRHRTGAEVGE